MTTESQPQPAPPQALFSPTPQSPTHDTPPPLPNPSMPAFAPQFPPQPANNGQRVQNRHSRDFSGSQTNGQVQSPNGQQGVPIQHRMGNGHQGHVRGMSGFDGPRSPPNSKSERLRHKKHSQKTTTADPTELKGTAHVPCKFYRQGVCQAGKACPFLHTNDLATETAPCKYFQKGNCKFGAKCALAHILPDGRRVNGPNLAMGRHPYGRPPTTQSSLLTMQAMAGGSQYPYMPSDEPYQSKHLHDMIPTIDQTFSSNPGSNFGSPPNDSRLPTSPVQKGLSVLDAPLPASFDSQGISHMARYGPIAASVPSRFGLEASSPPSSYQNKAIETSTLRNLHSSAFGDDAFARNGLGSSPPAAEEPMMGRRIMHSERFARPKMMSASLGTRPIIGADEWDENFAFEEDLVPNSLHELLTPQEKMRRFSRAGDDESAFNHRQSLSGLGTPGDSKVGSPLGSSPSRFGALFSRTHKPADEVSSSPGANVFGHVGSPLRGSGLNPNASPSLRPIGDRRTPSTGDASPFGLASPPRQSSISTLSQQLQRTRLSSLVSESKPEGPEDKGHPGMPGRLTSASSIGSAASRSGIGMDRAISSSSIGREPIEEEQEQGLFDMEEEDSGADKEKKAKRLSSGLGTTSAPGGAWGVFPGLGAGVGSEKSS
ncbi:putative spindle poison sensitivity protein scp3 protein [Lasiodiplodia theobromae]|uniref:Protein cps3 n=2 Tax=Lasiodiplodia TaxID=66739 RepID=A0A5N5D1G5_9PEZI|nr:Spindle poison sensitivity protein scp3 [Lasiodiplodia theobromae]KAB2571513.1 Protein cps3 [Lasiodiplodia theobromae]KAF4536107.1 Spindle poison sensitivity protein scp3 [Lasiodiplodia theobromae]KAF9634359.1 putative spindle poison sensitivity protein scp3 protein [Lasiodiplodia theobromae]KAK0625741.1 Protein cps3 [Lasiodiplodia hormozganensis]